MLQRCPLTVRARRGRASVIDPSTGPRRGTRFRRIEHSSGRHLSSFGFRFDKRPSVLQVGHALGELMSIRVERVRRKRASRKPVQPIAAHARRTSPDRIDECAPGRFQNPPSSIQIEMLPAPEAREPRSEVRCHSPHADRFRFAPLPCVLHPSREHAA